MALDALHLKPAIVHDRFVMSSWGVEERQGRAGMAYRMLVVDDKANMREMLASTFSERGFVVTEASNGLDAISLVREQVYDIVITDLSMPGENGIAVLRAAREVSPDTHVIIITAFGTIDTAVEAMRLGASDFITKPFNIAVMEHKVETLFRQEPAQPEAGRPSKTWLHPSIQHMVGTSAQTKSVLKMIEKIAPSRSSVLIIGPTGTGKELVARAIHDSSPRRDRPFVALNCAALAPGVLESELFGHEKGSFTGATERRIGRFEKAHTGTLFLDEVGEIDAGIQTKLLRVLQSGEFERVGGTQTIKVDVRIVAATNRDLTEAIQRGLFREDFYYRLKVFSLVILPLRNRRDDIPALIDHFLRKFSIEMNKEVHGVDDDVIEFFLRYPWPGNVRELENILERAVVLAEGPTITRNELPQEILYTPADVETTPVPTPEGSSLIDRTDQLESELIRGALERYHWNKTKAAEHLGLKRTTLQYKIKKYGLE
jgi:two-component system NtrC family response regulator